MSTPLTVTRIGHACQLIEIGGTRVLTDPWFSQKPGYYHGEPLALTPTRLPRLAAVVASHRHYDHYDLAAFAAYLKANDFKFTANEAVRGAEQLPLASLDKIAQMKDGQSMFTVAPGGVSVLYLAGSRSQPSALFLSRGGLFGSSLVRLPRMASSA